MSYSHLAMLAGRLADWLHGAVENEETKKQTARQTAAAAVVQWELVKFKFIYVFLLVISVDGKIARKINLKFIPSFMFKLFSAWL